MRIVNLAVAISLAFSLHTVAVLADDAPKKPDVESDLQLLKEHVFALQAEVRALKTILTAKGVRPPRPPGNVRAHPDTWTEVRIKVDANAVIWKDGRAHDLESIRRVFGEVYKEGKYPFLMIAKHPDLSEEKFAPISVSLLPFGPMSFMGWTE